MSVIMNNDIEINSKNLNTSKDYNKNVYYKIVSNLFLFLSLIPISICDIYFVFFDNIYIKQIENHSNIINMKNWLLIRGVILGIIGFFHIIIFTFMNPNSITWIGLLICFIIIYTLEELFNFIWDIIGIILLSLEFNIYILTSIIIKFIFGSIYFYYIYKKNS